MTNQTTFELPPYLVAQSLQDVYTFVPAVLINYQALPDANVLVALKDGGYMLAKVSPPNRVVQVYMSKQNSIVYAEVEQLFKVIQTMAFCWCQM